MRSRLYRFAARLLLLAVAATAIVTGTWVHFVGRSGPAWAWCILPGVLTASFVPAMLLGLRFSHPLLPVVTIVSAIAIGFLSFGLFAAVSCWIVAAFAAVLHAGIPMGRLAEVVYAAAAAVAAYGLVNSLIPRTVRLTVALPGLPDAWNGRTVALLSDIHLGNVRGPAFVRHLVWRIQRHRPEAVFISGDMFDGTELDVDRAAAPWKGLSAPAGVFFVTGNHDDRGKRAIRLAALERAGLRVLNNEKATVRGLQIVGVHDAETHAPERYRQILAQARIEPGTAAILLAHQPVNLGVPEAAGISLQLSGHTHAGQFWPWSLIARRVHGPYVHGLNRFGRMLIYTSSGAGTWGPPFRVGTRSEIVFLRLEAAAG